MPANQGIPFIDQPAQSPLTPVFPRGPSPGTTGIPPEQAPGGPFADQVAIHPQPVNFQDDPNQRAPTSGITGPLAMFASKFLAGANQGRQNAYIKSEREKMQHAQNYDNVYTQIAQNPNISKEGKQKAYAAWMDAKYGQIHQTLKDSAKDNKDNPLWHFTKALTHAALGDSSNANRRDFGPDSVNTLLDIAHDEQYKIDPQQLQANAAARVSSAIQDLRTGQPGQSAGTDAQGNNIPRVDPAGLPRAPQEVNSQTLLAHPEVQGAISDLNRAGIPWQDSVAGNLIKSAPAPPTPLEQAHIRLYGDQAARYGAQAANYSKRVEGSVELRGPDGKARYESISYDPQTMEKYDGNGDPLPDGDPRRMAPFLRTQDYSRVDAAGMRTAGQNPKFATNKDGLLMRWDAGSQQMVALKDDQGQLVHQDTALGRLMQTQGFQEGHFNREMAMKEARESDTISQNEQHDILVAEKGITDPKRRKEAVARIKNAAEMSRALLKTAPPPTAPGTAQPSSASGQPTAAPPVAAKKAAQAARPPAAGAAPAPVDGNAIWQKMFPEAFAGTGAPAAKSNPYAGKK